MPCARGFSFGGLDGPCHGKYKRNDFWCSIDTTVGLMGVRLYLFVEVGFVDSFLEALPVFVEERN